MEISLFLSLTCLVVIGLPFLGWFLSKRYGGLTTVKIFGGAVTLSLLIGFIGFVIVNIITGKWHDDIHWTRYKTIEGTNMFFEYHPKFGLYVVNEDGNEIQITDQWPYCNIANNISEIVPDDVYITGELNLLSDPPQEEVSRINFVFAYPTNEYHSYSSFIVSESGEVWCAERHWEGMADAGDISVGTGLAMLALYLINLQVCTFSFILILAILIGVFEIQRSRVRKLTG